MMMHPTFYSTAGLPVVPVKGGFSVHVTPPSVHTFSAPRVTAPAPTPRVSTPSTTTRTITVTPSWTKQPTVTPPVQQTIVVHHDYAPSYYHPAWYYPLWIHPWSQQTTIVQSPGGGSGCYGDCGYGQSQSHWLAFTAIVVLMVIVAAFVWSRWEK